MMFCCWLCLTGVSVDHVDKLGRTALFTACLEGHENVAEMLLKYGADVNLWVFAFHKHKIDIPKWTLAFEF